MSDLPPLQQFLSRFDEDDNGCWIWQGKPHQPRNGYGRWRGSYIHRLSYQTFIGPIPDGLTIDHLCSVPMCGNPDHLEAVENRINVLRAAVQARKTHCPKGHPYDDDNTWLTTEGGRTCRTCHRVKALAYYYARKEP